VAIDRTKTLRQAEKLMRQGRVDAAIEEYQRVLAAFPHDWTTANSLGDCYYRTNQADKAVEQYVRIADHLLQDGKQGPANTLYRKVLKIKPDHEHALLKVATSAAAQGALDEARQHLATVADLRRARGDTAGAAEVLVRLGNLDPANLDARLDAFRKALDAGAGDRVAGELDGLAAALADAGRRDDAIALLERGVGAMPENVELRTRLARLWLEHGDRDKARACAATADELVLLADVYAGRGETAAEEALLSDAWRLAPDDLSIVVRLVRTCAARGDYQAACAHLDAAGDVYDPELFAIAGEVRARAGDPDRARGIFARLLAREPHRTAALADQGLAVDDAQLALLHVEAAADAQLARGDTLGAIDVYRRFNDRFSGHIPALLRLVDITVDAGLEQEIAQAQSRLADAYLAEGRAAEARVIAEDLLTRQPGDAQHVERLRRTLVALHEPDVDAIIAERLSAMKMLGVEELPADLTGAADEDQIAPAESAGVAGESANADFQVGAAGPAAAEAGGRTEDGSPFKGFHDDMSRHSLLTAAEQHYKLAVAYEEVGMPDEAMKELQAAVRSPRRRFEAAAMLGRLSRDGGRVNEAIDWFERAAEAPAPSIDASRKLLYDLGDALEVAGEHSRALAVFLELQTESGTYRDVGRRIERLTRTRTGSGG
jgi:tetratricopeptide (TPR) repeat protein